MAETLLRGVGDEPAVDQLTGMPLTMEELLRRRGIVAYNGNVRPSPLDASSAGGGAMDALNSGAPVLDDTGALITSGTAPTSPSSAPLAPVDNPNAPIGPRGETPAQLDAMDDNAFNSWVEAAGGWAQLAAVGAATGLGWYLAQRRARNGNLSEVASALAAQAPRVGTEAMQGEVTYPTRAPREPVDGEFSVVEALQDRNRGTRRLTGPRESAPARTGGALAMSGSTAPTAITSAPAAQPATPRTTSANDNIPEDVSRMIDEEVNNILAERRTNGVSGDEASDARIATGLRDFFIQRYRQGLPFVMPRPAPRAPTPRMPRVR